MVQRLGLEPRIDVERLASSLATVTTKRFPTEIDGLCLDLKTPGKRPKVWVSHSLSNVRRRFTLAHEIGHIIIPWHTGTIVDDLDAPRTADGDGYREMEAEANRFAAELLMPTAWVLRTIERTAHAAALMNTIVNVAEVSYPAAFLRVMKLAPSGFVGAEIVEDIVVRAGRTRNTRTRPPKTGSHLENLGTDALHEPQVLRNGPTSYFWWEVRDEVRAPPAPGEPWRSILDRILLDVPAEHRAITRSRVNAVVGSAFGRTPKGTAADKIYAVALQATQNRTDRDIWLRTVFRHGDFQSYLVARCHAHAASGSRAKT